MTKAKKINPGLRNKVFAAVLVICLSINSYGQQQFVHTSTKENNNCNGDCTLLDIPELNNNPAAIIWATPILDKGLNLNPHPIGVYYFRNQWNIFNLDQRALPAGARFNVEYVARPDDNHFRFVVTKDNIQQDGSVLIDHPALNNNPDAQFQYFLNWNPAELSGPNNRDEVKAQFNNDAGKWYFSNVSKKPLYLRVAYNIILSSGSNDTTVNTIPIIDKPVTTKPINTSPVNTNPANNKPVGTNSAFGFIQSMSMTIWADGKKWPGENSNKSNADKTQILSYEMGSSMLTSPGQLPGKKVYESITIKSFTGAPITTLLFNAFVNSQKMEFAIETYSPGGTAAAGLLQLNYTIKLTDAQIVSFKQVYIESTLKDKISNDEIKIIFKKIEFIKGTISVVDNL